MAQECDPEAVAGWNKATRAFKNNPTIEHYVKLRRDNPDEIIEVAITSGLEWLISNEDTLKAVGIPPSLVAGMLDADQADISELSLLLLEKIIERKKLERLGQTHIVSRGQAIGDSLINFLISMILDSLDWNDSLVMPRDLIVLLRERIGGEISSWEKTQETKEFCFKAMTIAIQIAAKGETPSYRKIGKILSVSATTVMRWFPDSSMIELAKNIAESSKKWKSTPDTKAA